MSRDREQELEALRQYLDRSLQELRRQIRGENYDHFLINFTRLESSLKQGQIAAEQRYTKSMQQAAEMRTRKSHPGTIERLERMAAEALERDKAFLKRLLDSFIRDCAPPGFRIVE